MHLEYGQARPRDLLQGICKSMWLPDMVRIKRYLCGGPLLGQSHLHIGIRIELMVPRSQGDELSPC